MHDIPMSKNDDNQKTEKGWYEFWDKNGFFKAEPGSKKPKYSLLIPPPNLTGELHLGHAMQHSILDAIARYKRMQGFDVLLLPGVDHAGIQFESTFDKKLAKEGLSKQKLGREKWLEKAWEFKDEVYKSVSATWRFMGLSADWSREVFTLDEAPRRAVFEEFKAYFEKDLIYKGPYIVQWCPKDQTAIEDVEVEYLEQKDKLYFVKYPLAKNKNKFVTIATVRPETMFADAAITVNPKDKRYKDLIGEKVVVPFVNREVPIIADDAVDVSFGSGAVKCDPAHDLDDFRRAKDHNLQILAAIGKDGKLTDLAGEFTGLKSLEAREKIFESLEKMGLAEKSEEIVHNVSVCERCKTPTELLISEEWFVKVSDMAKDAVKLIKTGKINFLPENYAKIISDWLINIHDWCISRSLWWGHRIPVWYRTSIMSHESRVKLADRDIRVSLESPGEGWVQDEQVLDTWFSSGLWPLSTLGWPFGVNPQGKPQKNKEFEKYFPWDFEITAPEIKYLWIARMIMISDFFTKQVPFKTMFFHGMLRDLQGRKFSKSLGNGVEPGYLIDNWGVDATRMTLYSYSVPGRDGRVSRQIMDERGKNFRNFATKLRNIAKFIIDLKPEDSATSLSFKHKDDKWVKEELDITIKNVTKNIESLNLHLASDEIYDFIWHKLADKYLEQSKNRRSEAQPVLEHVLYESIKLLHPFMPFVTEEIYQKFDKIQKSIMVDVWPKNA